MRRLMSFLSITTLLFVAVRCSGGDAVHDDEAVTRVASAQPPAADGATASATADTIEVWKDPNCGCCKSWVEHMRKHGFTVIAHDTSDLTPVKQKRGVGADLASCHTGVIHGYTIEGHVPADLVRKMIDEKPAIAGLAVPGMPMGSPGMEGGTPMKYDVIAFTADGGRKVYASR
ncbi:MAG: DUF411 domain-containing protein [Longimicrobiales bacterium]